MQFLTFQSIFAVILMLVVFFVLFKIFKAIAKAIIATIVILILIIGIIGLLNYANILNGKHTLKERILDFLRIEIIKEKVINQTYLNISLNKPLNNISGIE